MAISIFVILTGLMAPEKGPRIRKDLSRQVICSHLTIDARLSPPCPLDSSTWVDSGEGAQGAFGSKGTGFGVQSMPGWFSFHGKAFLLCLSRHNGWDYAPPVFAVQIKIAVQGKYATLRVQFAHLDQTCIG
jgi:hypothetical protein